MEARDTRETAAGLGQFREKITEARRQAGRQQQELARALGLAPHVLSRKLHGLEQAHLTHAEVKQLIQTLAAWDAITTQDEANDLLALMGLKPTSFSEQEWKTAPLNRLDPVLATWVIHSKNRQLETEKDSLHWFANTGGLL
jgi:ribosome-binding protein aMBF1 (putative translation factor)